MAPWTFSVMFPYDTQFIFESLMFTVGEDGNLELLTREPMPRHPAPVYGIDLYYLSDVPTSSTSGGARAYLNPCAGPYYFSTMTSQQCLIGTTIFLPSVGTSSSSFLGATPDRDSIEDYLEIGGSAYWNPAIKARHISMVGPDMPTLRIVPVGIGPSGGPKRPMLGHPAVESFKI
jgi:hypothetical protein